MTAPDLAPHLDHGLWVVLASPFDDDLALDDASLERQLRLADSVSAQGVVALGVFGEADALTRAEQQQVVRTVTGCRRTCRSSSASPPARRRRRRPGRGLPRGGPQRPSRP